MIRKIVATILNLQETVTGAYGSGMTAYAKFFYFSFFSRNTFKVFALDVRSFTDIPELSPDGFTMSAPTVEQLRSFRQGRKLPREFFYDEIHDLSTFHVASAGEEIAYIHWLYHAGQPSRFFHLEEGVVEVNNCHTLPPYRGKGLMTRVCRYTAHTLKPTDVRHLLMVIHSDNIASIKSAVRAGFYEVCQIRSLGPFNTKVRTSTLKFGV